MQNAVRPTLHLVPPTESRSTARETFAARDLAERVLMFAVVAMVWAMVLVAALQAAQ